MKGMKLSTEFVNRQIPKNGRQPAAKERREHCTVFVPPFVSVRFVDRWTPRKQRLKRKCKQGGKVIFTRLFRSALSD